MMLQNTLTANNFERISYPSPVVGICGFSNSGKTTLIERLIQRLNTSGFSVAVIKHHIHGFVLDVEGKDTDRFFRAGATVFARDSHQNLLRKHCLVHQTVSDAIRMVSNDHDLILVEGHKSLEFPTKIWLRRSDDDSPPSNIGHVSANLGLNEDRINPALAVVHQEISRHFKHRPVYGGIFVQSDQRTWVDTTIKHLQPFVQTICLVGMESAVSHYDNFPKFSFFPSGTPDLRSAVLAVLKSHDSASWIFTHQILNCESDISILLSSTRPGVWAIVPPHSSLNQNDSSCIWIDSRMRSDLENSDNLDILYHHPKSVILQP